LSTTIFSSPGKCLKIGFVVIWGRCTQHNPCTYRGAPQIRRSHLHPHNELLGAIADALADALAADGKLAEAAQQCSASLDVLSQSYPPDSTAVAHAKLKLAALLQPLQRDEQQAQLVQDALTVLRLHHGEAAATAIVQSHQG
jgi:hypothetical protein